MPAGAQGGIVSEIWFHGVACIALVVAGCGGGGHSPDVTTPTTGPITGSTTGPATGTAAAALNTRVVTIGDSITGGRAPVVPYPPRLEALLKRRNPQAVVINRGVPGQIAPEGAQTLTMSLTQERPNWVLIMEGTNDVNLGHSPVQTASSLQEMARLTRQFGAVPILATIPPQFGPQAGVEAAVVALNDEIRRIASQQQVTLADVFRALPDASFFTDDGFHPNDKGQTAIAAVFDAALASAGYPTTLIAHRRR
jgi:lysophospholipase L1-like esterase